jgi:hypothetical protein
MHPACIIRRFVAYCPEIIDLLAQDIQHGRGLRLAHIHRIYYNFITL